MKHLIIGIDEVGRGPLFGPVSIGIFSLYSSKENIFFKKLKFFLKRSNMQLKDSKKLTHEARKKFVSFLKNRKDEGMCEYVVVSMSSSSIDAYGISYCIKKLIKKGLKKISNISSYQPQKMIVYLDGGLYAPKEYIHQYTIIKGDENKTVITFASIIAKEKRDAYMRLLQKNKKYSKYAVGMHMGYGTLVHRKAIARFGLSDKHRITYISEKIR
ncbi:MAG: hypothetical protein QM526_02235 [Alphaproteobacteria bacterium]|nr:hypothetical protein [Alphaproteobacteria bacterium]